MTSRRERGERPPRRDREHGRDEVRPCSHGRPVRPSVGDHEQHVLLSSIAHLEDDPTGLRLEIADPRLSLEWQIRRRRVRPKATDPRVPRTLIARDREGNLGPEGQGGVEALSASLEQPDVGGVADRVWAWERADTDIEPDDRADPRELDHRGRRRNGAFDPRELRRGEPDRAANGRERQPGGHASRPQVGAGATEVRPSDPGAAIHGSLTRRHGVQSGKVGSSGAYPPLATLGMSSSLHVVALPTAEPP